MNNDMNMDIAYYPGCTLHESSELYDVQTKIIMEALGMRLHELDDWNCCGATSSSKTDDYLAIALPARNLGIADSMNIAELVIPCSACYSRMITAQERLQNNSDLMDEINHELEKKVTGETGIVSILKVINRTLEAGIFQKKIVRKIDGLNPVCYYGCLQTRFPCDTLVEDDIENPQAMENILLALGINPIDWSYKTACCGASAAMNDNALSLDLMGKILKDALDRDANCLVVSCPMCQLNLDAYQKQIDKTIMLDQELPVFFITEIVGLAMGKSIKELQVDRHFVDTTSLLKEVSLI